jgi:CheY-like chemotaxis protein
MAGIVMPVFTPRSATPPADSASPVRVLVVEANAEDARALVTALGNAKRAAFEAVNAVSLADALERLSRETFQVVLLSLPLPDNSGSAAIQAIGQQFPALPIIVITHLNDESAALECCREALALDAVQQHPFHHRGIHLAFHHVILRPAQLVAFPGMRHILACANVEVIVGDLYRGVLAKN